jgi:hypothetical protein
VWIRVRYKFNPPVSGKQVELLENVKGQFTQGEGFRMSFDLVRVQPCQFEEIRDQPAQRVSR